MGATGHINVKSFRFNLFQENSYVLWNEGGDCVLVDPGCYSTKESSALKAFITDNGLNPKAIWLTHGHFDHIFGVAEMSREYSLPVWMSPEDRFILDKAGEYANGVGLKAPDVGFETKELVDGQILRYAQDDTFQVIATPGHTPGCVCFYSEKAKMLFSGDTLFAGAIGRTDLDGGDYDKEIVGIMEKLMVLPGDVEVFPGHGPGTNIAIERTTNPFLQPFNEPWEYDETDQNDICI